MPTRKLKNTDHIYERLSVDGRLTSYQVKIRRKGFPSQTGSFDDLDDAKRFVRLVLSDQDRGHKVDRLISHRKTVVDVINGGIAALESGKRQIKGVKEELYRLNAIKRDYSVLMATPLSDASEESFEDWIEHRLETVKPNTVLRDFNILKPLFAKAVRTYDLRRSPLEYIKPPREIDERPRRLLEEEEELLFAELHAAEDSIVPLAAQFALESGCRRSEQLRVEWRHYDRKTSTIWLPDAKNGRGRYLLLTELAQDIVEALPGREEGGKIFKCSSNQLKKAFEYARIRAAKRAEALGRPDLKSVETFRWHDLRHEAVSRCFDAGWTSEQVMDFSGHVDIKSLLRYRSAKVDQSVARLRTLERDRSAGQPTIRTTALTAWISGGRAKVDA